MKKPVRVLIVDDSALMRKLLTTLLNEDPDIEVVGASADAQSARESIKALDPEVLTLDVEMPGMNGIAFLEKIMELRPMPVVMVSSLTQEGADVTIRALEIGTVDFVEKPSGHGDKIIAVFAEELRKKVKAAAGISFGPRRGAAKSGKTQLPARPARLVAIGASTGGVETLRALLCSMEADCPPIVVAQHMPPRFTTAFANRLNTICPMRVREASHGEMIEPGAVYIAPGGQHLEVVRRGAKFYCALNEDSAVSGHRPSVDVLFHSVAKVAGQDALGVILTGMGKDGAEGLLSMRSHGALTVGQDESTSLIYGMPREAFECGAVEAQLSLDEIGPFIMSAWNRNAPHDGRVALAEPAS